MLKVRDHYRDGNSQPTTHPPSPACLALYLHQHFSTDSLRVNADVSNNSLFRDLSSSPSSHVPSTHIRYLIKQLNKYAELTIECNICALIYIIRFLEKGGGVTKLTHWNWRPILCTAFIIASKVQDDLSMWNNEFNKIFKIWRWKVNLKTLNARELAFLQAIQFDVIVSASEYTTWYFKLRDVSHTRSVLVLQRRFVADGKCSRTVLPTSLQAMDLDVPEHLKKGCKAYTDLLRRLNALDLHGANLDIHEYLKRDGEWYTRMFIRVWQENRERQ